MIISTGIHSHYLYIDLTNRSYWVKRLGLQEQRLLLGGKGIGLLLFSRQVEDLSDLDPHGEENPLCIMSSALSGTKAPCSARFEVLSRSPLTGRMASSSGTGPFGFALKTAGFDGLVLIGRASEPTVVHIDYEQVTFLPAQKLWGLGTRETEKALSLTSREAALEIGPAGENLVPYANLRSGKESFGRGGLGAVMGSKLLKAIVVRGRDYLVRPIDPRTFEATRKAMGRSIERNPMSRRYREEGTNTHWLVSVGAHSVNNHSSPSDERVSTLTGERMAERYRQRFDSCRSCAVLCSHKGSYPDGRSRRIPEMNTSALLGPGIGVYNPDIIGQWSESLCDLGLDPLSTGNTIAWAMEASQRGIVEYGLEFGKAQVVGPLIRSIAYREGIGAELCLGTRALSRMYEQSGDFACQTHGLEMEFEDPRSSLVSGLYQVVGARGDAIDQSVLTGLESLLGKDLSDRPQKSVEWVIWFEDLIAALDSLSSCPVTLYAVLFESPLARVLPRELYSTLMLRHPERMTDLKHYSQLFSSLTGLSISAREFYAAGRRVVLFERYLNSLMDRTAEETLPSRFLEEFPLQEMLAHYYQKRGYDEHGFPTEETLERSGLGPCCLERL